MEDSNELCESFSFFSNKASCSYFSMYTPKEITPALAIDSRHNFYSFEVYSYIEELK